VTSLAVFKAAIRAKSTHLIKSCLKTRLTQADARGSADIIYRMWCISSVCGSACRSRI